MSSIHPPRGMRDILPQEMRLRSKMLELITSTYESYGFNRIETPAIEDLQILLRDASSENTKLIFPILKRGESLDKVIEAKNFKALADLGLRYDLTVPLARYFASNRAKLPSIFKSIQIGPVWRAERPQKGRYRQFYQCDIDILGSRSFYSELELVSASAQALLTLGLKSFVIHINDRRILSDLLESCEIRSNAPILITLDKMDKIGVEGVKQELNQYGIESSKIERLLTLIARSNQDMMTLARESQLNVKVVEELQTIIMQLNQFAEGKYQCVFNPTLIRGMGYYTGPIFEITYKDYPYAIAGGGRYDQMIEDLIQINVPACGISLGFERLVGILAEEQLIKVNALETIALLYENNVNPWPTLQELKKKGQKITLHAKHKNISKQLNELLASGITKYMILDAQHQLSSVKEIAFK